MKHTDKINIQVVFKNKQNKILLVTMLKGHFLKRYTSKAREKLVMVNGSAKITLHSQQHNLILGNTLSIAPDSHYNIQSITTCQILISQ